MLVGIIRSWKWPDLMKQTPGNSGVWGDIKFTEQLDQALDYCVVINNVQDDFLLSCPPENVYRVVQEPPVDFLKSWHINPYYSAKTFTCDPERLGSEYIRSHPMVPWHINRDYDYLAKAPVPEKSAPLSWITSTKNVLDGHKKRMGFLDTVTNGIPGLELVGTNVHHIANAEARKKNTEEQLRLGFKIVEDKWEGLAPYKYSLAIENFSGPDYWTEKLADCFLAWTLPIYYGCTNLEDYFPTESFVRIDIDDVQGSIATIRRVLEEDIWEKRLDAIKEARELALNRYQLFPAIAERIAQDSTASKEKKAVYLRGFNKATGYIEKPDLIFSVVVCTYNREDLLAECLKSLESQTFNSAQYEVIVVDNNSSDNTRAVANEFVKNNRNYRLLSEPEQGLSHARNKGLAEAQGEYIAYIDDDARVAENWLEMAAKIVAEHSPDIFGGPAFPIFGMEKPCWYKEQYAIRGYREESGWVERGYIVGTNIFFKKILLNEYGGFDPELGMKGDSVGYHEETELVHRAFREKRKVYYSNSLAVKDLLPNDKLSLAYFISSKYKAGYDGDKLWGSKIDVHDAANLSALLNDTMNDLDYALRARDETKYLYPENYIIECMGGKFVEIGRLTKNCNNDAGVDLSSGIEPEDELKNTFLQISNKVGIGKFIVIVTSSVMKLIINYIKLKFR